MEVCSNVRYVRTFVLFCTDGTIQGTGTCTYKSNTIFGQFFMIESRRKNTSKN